MLYDINMKLLLVVTTLTLSGLVSAKNVNNLININVYTTQNYQIKNPKLATNIYYLDAVVLLENKIEQQLKLSNIPRVAEKQAKKIINAAEWKQYEQQLKKSYYGVTFAWSQGVMKVPAVVFSDGEGDSVIYGVTDISVAINLYNQWKNQQHRR